MSYLTERFGGLQETADRAEALSVSVGQWADALLAADEDDPPYVLGGYILQTSDRLAEEEAEKESETSPLSMLGVMSVAKSAGKFMIRALAVGARWVLNIVRGLIFSAIRVSWKFIVRPLITGLFSFLVSPPGLIALGIGAAAGLGYVLYKYLKQDPTAAQPEPRVTEPMPPGVPDVQPPPPYQDDAQERAAAASHGFLMENLPHQPEYDEATGLHRATSSSTGVRRPYTRQQEQERTSAAMSYGGGQDGASYDYSGGQRISQTSDGNLKPRKGGLDKGALFRAMDRYGITDIRERAMFLAQMHHESGNFRYAEEIWGPTKAQRGYEGRKNLGNTQPGDGYRYKGRGFIQLTGRDNYRRAGKFLGLDLEGNPGLAGDSDVAAAVAIWYWTKERKYIPIRAREGNVHSVTKLINGGYNGLADRQQLYAKYLAELSANPSYGSEFSNPPTPPSTDLNLEGPSPTSAQQGQDSPIPPGEQGQQKPQEIIRVDNKLVQVPL